MITGRTKKQIKSWRPFIYGVASAFDIFGNTLHSNSPDRKRHLNGGIGKYFNSVGGYFKKTLDKIEDEKKTHSQK